MTLHGAWSAKPPVQKKPIGQGLPAGETDPRGQKLPPAAAHGAGNAVPPTQKCPARAARHCRRSDAARSEMPAETHVLEGGGTDRQGTGRQRRRRSLQGRSCLARRCTRPCPPSRPRTPTLPDTPPPLHPPHPPPSPGGHRQGQDRETESTLVLPPAARGATRRGDTCRLRPRRTVGAWGCLARLLVLVAACAPVALRTQHARRIR